MNYKSVFTVVLSILSCYLHGNGKYDSIIFSHRKESVLSDKEHALLIEEAKKKLTEFGFQSVQTCVLYPENCNSPIISKILQGSEAMLLLQLEAHFIYLNNDADQKRFVYQILSPWVADDFIEHIFEQHSSSIGRANAFGKELLPLIKKLSKLFLANKI